MTSRTSSRYGSKPSHASVIAITSSRIPKGIFRLLSLLPIVFVVLLLPLTLHSFHFCGPTTFFLVWLCPFKLLLFAFGQGPLSPLPPNILHFILISSLPIKIKPKHLPNNYSEKRFSKLILFLKLLLLAAIVRAYDHRNNLHPHFILFLYCCHMYLSLELVLALCVAPARVFGFQIEPQFNEPYLITSLQDFWGRRWNLMVTGILRPTVYDPIRRISMFLLGQHYGPMPATLAKFAVSGLMHELIYYYLKLVPPTWEVTWFFVLHGMCTAVERLDERKGKRKKMSRRMCMHEEEIKNLIKVYLTIFVSLSYCFFIGSRIPKGKLRFVSLSPVFIVFILLPLKLSSVIPTGITALFITWLSTFKLVLFSFDLGPLSSHHQSKSLHHFLLISSLPIKTIQNPKKTPKLPLNSPIKTLLFVLILPTLNQKQNLHPKLLLVIYCCCLYFLIDVISGICNSVTKAIFGMELQMPSDEPYLSTSLQDFWGRRWNLMVTGVLRDAVYKPVRSICGPTLGSIVGVVAAFVVSGLMHELIFYYVTREPPNWEVTCFFVLHGVCMVVEFRVKKLLGQLNWGLCSVVYGPIMVAFVIVTAHWLFFPPLVINRADERAAKEFMNFLECMMGKIGSTQLHD